MVEEFTISCIYIVHGVPDMDLDKPVRYRIEVPAELNQKDRLEFIVAHAWGWRPVDLFSRWPIFDYTVKSGSAAIDLRETVNGIWNGRSIHVNVLGPIEVSGPW